MTTDKEHLQWMLNRLAEVHGENRNIDYMVRTQKIIDSTKTELNLHLVICFLVKTAIEENNWRVEDNNELGGDEANEMIDAFKDKISKELKVIGVDIANCI